MDTKLLLGLALMAPAVLFGLVVGGRWAWNHPKEFGEGATIVLFALAIIAAIVGVFVILSMWFTWWIPVAITGGVILMGTFLAAV